MNAPIKTAQKQMCRKKEKNPSNSLMSPYSRTSKKKLYFQKNVSLESENKFQNYVPDHTASQVQSYS